MWKMLFFTYIEENITLLSNAPINDKNPKFTYVNKLNTLFGQNNHTFSTNEFTNNFKIWQNLHEEEEIIKIMKIASV